MIGREVPTEKMKVGWEKVLFSLSIMNRTTILRNHGMLVATYLGTFDHFYQLDLDADCGPRPVFWKCLPGNLPISALSH